MTELAEIVVTRPCGCPCHAGEVRCADCCNSNYEDTMYLASDALTTIGFSNGDVLVIMPRWFWGLCVCFVFVFGLFIGWQWL